MNFHFFHFNAAMISQNVRQRNLIPPNLTRQNCLVAVWIGHKASSLQARNATMHTHPFNGPFSGTTRVSRYPKGKKPIWILLKQETVSGSGISWAICKFASRSRQIATPVPQHSVFLQAGCPSCRPTNSVKALKATNATMQATSKQQIMSHSDQSL